MSSYIAAVATHVASSADAVARTLAPVDSDALAGTRAEYIATADKRPALRVAEVLQKSAEDVRDLAVRGYAFRLSDIPAYVNALKGTIGGDGIDDRKMLLEKILTLMSRLPDNSQFSKTLQILVIDLLYKDLPHPPAAYLPLPPGGGAKSYPSTSALSYVNGHVNGHANGHAEGHANGSADPTHGQQPYSHPTYGTRRPYAARSADGTGYSTVYPDMGAAGRPYARTVAPTHPHISWPDAGLVFDALLARRPSAAKKGALPSSSPDALPGYTTLPPTNVIGFAPQPAGISSLFFAFADLVIHSIFNTSHSDWGINNVSSYLDLSPLYGSNEADLRKVRRNDGTGRLWEDVFADGRLLFMPPSVPALLVLFCRNHNYIASKLLAINESGTFASGDALAQLNDDDRQAQDDEIFARSRLVNCGWFMRVILGDYVGSILGLVRDGLAWRLDPLAESRELDHVVSPRGEGNVVSLEFNLLYRWHAALSERDAAWTEHTFEKMFNTNDFKSITVDQFQKTLATKVRPDPDVRKWTFDGVDNKPLGRDTLTGAFKSVDLAELLQSATDAHAGAFKARGIPEVLRVVEVMGIEQARQWGASTMNEFRKFMGLKAFNNFSEWNSDPEISKTAESLYGHIDNLELYPGLMAEEAKPPIPGAGLCPNYTISRAILADAVALVRGDRFLTTDFTVYNLTSWGYLDCFPQKDDGAYGGMLTRLLYRTLPEHYPARSSYARFPFMVPKVMREYLERLVLSPATKYDFSRPRASAPATVVDRYEDVKLILRNGTQYMSMDRVAALTGVTKLDFRVVNDTINYFNAHRNYPVLLEHLTVKLIVEKSISYPGSTKNCKYLDIVRDVINLVPVYFVATELMGLPVKTERTPNGLYRDSEFAAMFEEVCNYVLLNTDPYMDWVLRERSTGTASLVTAVVNKHLKRLTDQGIIGKLTDSLIQWYTGEDNFSDIFLTSVLENAAYDKSKVKNSIFGALIPSTALYAKVIVHVVDHYLDEQHATAQKEVIRLAHSVSKENDKMLLNYAFEALRLNPPVSSVLRKDESGRPFVLNVANANLDSNIFGTDTIMPDFSRPEKGILGLEENGLTSMSFLEATIPSVLRAIFRLQNLRRGPGSTGNLKRIVEVENGCAQVHYLNERSEITPFPTSMVVQYDG